VVLRRAGAAWPVIERWEEREWEQLGGLAGLEQELARGAALGVRVRGVPSARLDAERALVRRLGEAGEDSALEELRGELPAEQDAGAGVEPEALWQLERTTPYFVQVRFAEVPGSYELWCVRRATAGSRYGWEARGTAARRGRASEVLAEAAAQQRERELAQYLRERLPSALVPTRYVWLNSLPLTASGKLDRRALPAPEQQNPQSASGHVAPHGALQEQIAAIWQQLLGLERVSAHANFFDLGGHSLLLARAHARLRESFGTRLSVVDLFLYPTIYTLAQALAAEGAADRAGAAPIDAIPARRVARARQPTLGDTR
jgi:hypothetical protein